MPWSSTYYPVLQVEPFDSDESAAFLTRSIQNADIKNGGLRLGSSATHSPTQLIFLARMIDLERYSLDQFVKASQLDDGKQAILLLHAEDATKNQADFSEWALESLSPKAAALLDAMAMMDPDQIAERMLVQPPDSIMIPAYPNSMEDYIAARNELLSFSFIARDRTTANMTIHRMIQDAARGNMSEKRFRDVFNSCIALINDQWPYQAFTWRHSISRWARCEELYPHIVRLQYFSARAPTSEDDIDGAYGYARLATDVAWYCHERGRGPEVSTSFSTPVAQFISCQRSTEHRLYSSYPRARSMKSLAILEVQLLKVPRDQLRVEKKQSETCLQKIEVAFQGPIFHDL